ncbi:histidine phosphatase family protein [Bacillus kwashiorkori]|uniref:histidine phosphatase family protein n=1 Tax=Bacillus kwashiorkori TaxID=1522318 RepID=UPI000781566F|nr:histidine phosphatase family protein [Bacillus kwashiorkori]
MQITIIRHLPTSWNKKGLLQGRKDIEIAPITQHVQLEMEKVKQQMLKRLPENTFILTSTLKRTKQTAEAYGYEPISEPLLDELDFGMFEGKTKQLLIKKLGTKWIEDPRQLVLGEPLIDFENRIISFLNKYKTKSPLLVFGHGSWMRGLLSIYHYNSITNMNKFRINNNDCITLDFTKRKWVQTEMEV